MLLGVGVLNLSGVDDDHDDDEDEDDDNSQFRSLLRRGKRSQVGVWLIFRPERHPFSGFVDRKMCPTPSNDAQSRHRV
jgi:hypothetical protein